MESLHQSLPQISSLVSASIQQLILQEFQISEPVPITPVLNRPPLDYQIPVAIKLFNKMKNTTNPMDFKSAEEVALFLKSKFSTTDKMIEKLEANDQGFLFAVIKDTFLEDHINVILKKGIKLEAQTKTVVVDFSSPNIAKEMHVGHLRSTIIGESICRILEFLGHKVHRVNHLGDWGTQFGMLICHLKEAYPDFLTSLPVLSDLTAFYKQAKDKFDNNPEFKKRAQLMVVELQNGNQDCLKAWRALYEISMIEFNKIYKRLDISNEVFGESFYNSMLPGLVKDLEEQGFVKLDKGAKCMFVGKQIPLMVQKSDGGFNYDTTDLAAIKFRLTEIKADRVIYITDVGQYPHFELIFEAAKIIGWHKPPHTQLDHMGFGLVSDKSGQKFKTRSGETVKLIDLLNEAKDRASKQLKARLDEGKAGQQTNLTIDHIEEAGEKIGMAAIKYFDLKQNRISNYQFDYDKMLDSKGNTAVYLLYSYARLCSIITKANLSEDEIKSGAFKVTHPYEKILAMSVLRFPEVIETVVNELAIHKLCDFLYDLATKIGEGYNKYRIVDDPNKISRSLLILALKEVMKTGFWMLGISPLEKI